MSDHDGGRDDPQLSDGSDDGGDSGNDGPSWAERALVAVSTGFTVLLLAFVLWHVLTMSGGGELTATVTGTEPLQNGDVRITAALENGQDVGLISATVSVDCGGPTRQLTFEHVPAGGKSSGRVRCPAGNATGNGTVTANATVMTWVEA